MQTALPFGFSTLQLSDCVLPLIEGVSQVKLPVKITTWTTLLSNFWRVRRQRLWVNVGKCNFSRTCEHLSGGEERSHSEGLSRRESAQ
ncbi:hypothetical protein WJX75_008528 [Coccomyxa subellipsoidea]|uniref:Uncharacterized protein n=1 Tax=Coccomyxa subellipsoidea TaxID=248742 RepID=A0ABR2YUP8_9CHLO